MGRKKKQANTDLTSGAEEAALGLSGAEDDVGAAPQSSDAPEAVSADDRAIPVVQAEEAVITGWRVLKTARVWLYGQGVVLNEGKILPVISFDADRLARLREQGVELEAVK